ncbi:unnamed protein product [Ectocarpus sp. 12 AP-2014]
MQFFFSLSLHNSRDRKIEPCATRLRQTWLATQVTLGMVSSHLLACATGWFQRQQRTRGGTEGRHYFPRPGSAKGGSYRRTAGLSSLMCLQHQGSYDHSSYLTVLFLVRYVCYGVPLRRVLWDNYLGIICCSVCFRSPVRTQ